MTQPNVPDQQAIRRELIAAVNAGIDFGLPAPEAIRFGAGPELQLDSAADLCGWADWFGYAKTVPSTFGQPHPNLADPFQSDEWLTNLYFDWRGDTLHLGACDPITDEQRQHWTDSGQAANFAEPKATETATADPTGLTYSRELDAVMPVSPARGGPVHTGAVVDGGQLVDETPAEARTLSAAIHFSEARREAARLTGRTTSERLRVATLDLLHGQALTEDAERARRADVREGEQGRVINPGLAHFLAEKEERGAATGGPVLVVPHGPVRPPYGSPERAAWDAANEAR